jgi:hypothetical protein
VFWSNRYLYDISNRYFNSVLIIWFGLIFKNCDENSFVHWYLNLLLVNSFVMLALLYQFAIRLWMWGSYARLTIRGVKFICTCILFYDDYFLLKYYFMIWFIYCVSLEKNIEINLNICFDKFIYLFFFDNLYTHFKSIIYNLYKKTNSCVLLYNKKNNFCPFIFKTKFCFNCPFLLFCKMEIYVQQKTLLWKT